MNPAKFPIKTPTVLHLPSMARPVNRRQFLATAMAGATALAPWPARAATAPAAKAPTLADAFDREVEAFMAKRKIIVNPDIMPLLKE